MEQFFKNLPVLMDGATGTNLQMAGMPAGVCTESWVLENPEVLKKLQREYVAAGSGLLYAPTFGANRVNLTRHKVETPIPELVSQLVAISREAAEGKALVIGDISSTGLLLDPYGDTEEEELLEIFTEQAQALEDAGVDLFGVETQMYLDEALVAVKAVRSVSQKPLIVSFTCGPTGKTIWGEDFRDLLTALQPYNLSAFGVNCCGDLELVLRLVTELRAATDLPIIAKPNAGVPEPVNGVITYPLTPAEFAEYGIKYIEAGASLIGGCCGTTPAHIAELKKRIG